MTKPRLDGLYLLLLGSVAFLLLGTIMVNANAAAMVDFKVLYYPARCLIQHGDPYNEAEVMRISQAEAGANTWDPANVRHIGRYIYFPTTFSVSVPLAMLPWGLARALWITLTVASLLLASLLMWDIGAGFAPVLSGALIGFLLANSAFLMTVGNAAGIVISFCVIAAWCFFRERFALAGVLCLALSLGIKPHDAALVWVYFLLAGGVYRKRAIQALLVVLALSLPAVLWVSHVAPDWMQELHANVLAFSVRGGISDPALASRGGRALGMMINLQTLVSAFRDDPRVYNPVTYLVCAPLLTVWAFVTLRFRSSPRRVWLALAAISALSMLPTYHRAQDAKLLLLAIPACAMLWMEGGLLGWLALLVNALALVLTGDLVWILLFSLVDRLHLPAPGLAGQLVTAMQVFATPVILLVMGVFYLWLYMRRSSAGETGIRGHETIPESS
jgi:hypothetical protein